MNIRPSVFLHLKENPASHLPNTTGEFNLSQSVLPVAEVNPSFAYFPLCMQSCFRHVCPTLLWDYSLAVMYTDAHLF